MFHIVFQAGDVGVLTAAMDLDEALDGEMLLITDDYSVGPLGDLETESGLAHRRAWWLEILQQTNNPHLETAAAADNRQLQQIIDRMREEEFDQIWIWVAPNAQDVSGYYWLMSRLSEFAGRVQVISLNNLPFINDKGAVFYPTALSEIPPREFLKAKKLARPITLSEWETDPDEWTRLVAENKPVRVLEGAKKLVPVSADYYDQPLKKFITAEFQKNARIIHQYLSKSSQKTGEPFLNWRLRQLVANSEVEQQGESLRIPRPALGGIAEPA
jgi:hypothetical protein